MGIIRTTHTGFMEKVEGTTDKIPDFDPRSGNHFWIVVLSYKWDKKYEESILDHESLVYTSPPICFYCEQAYTSLLDTRRCKGHA